MAFPPTDLPAGDMRPIYSRERLPGGPWHDYRPVGGRVAAHLVTGAFLTIRESDGWLVERTGPVWVVQDIDSGDLTVLTPEEFASQYVLDG